MTDEQAQTQQNEDEFLGKAYPMPQKTPLKVDGTAIEYIILVPKGVKVKYPAGAYPARGAEAPPASDASKKALDEAKKQLEEKEAEVKKLSEEKVELSKTLDEIKLAEKKGKVEKLVDARIEKKLSEEADKEKSVEELMKLDDAQIEVLMSDLEKIGKNVEVKPKARNDQSEEEAKLSEVQKQEEEVRMKLFGHKKPLDEKEEKQE